MHGEIFPGLFFWMIYSGSCWVQRLSSHSPHMKVHQAKTNKMFPVVRVCQTWSNTCVWNWDDESLIYFGSYRQSRLVRESNSYFDYLSNTSKELWHWLAVIKNAAKYTQPLKSINKTMRDHTWKHLMSTLQLVFSP